MSEAASEVTSEVTSEASRKGGDVHDVRRVAVGVGVNGSPNSSAPHLLLLGPVRKVQTEDVSTREEEALDHFFGVGGGTERGKLCSLL